MKILDLVPLVRRLLLYMHSISTMLQWFFATIFIKASRQVMTSVREQIILRRFLRRNPLQRELVLELQVLDGNVHNSRVLFRGKVVFGKPREVKHEELW